MNAKVKLTGVVIFILVGGLVLNACGTFQVGVMPAGAEQAGAEQAVASATEIPQVTRGNASDKTGAVETPEEVQQETIQVTGWLGHVLSLPQGSQFDDYLELAPQDSGEFGLTGANNEIEAQVAALRDKVAPGDYANFWGELTCGVPDYGGCQLVVSKVRSGATATDPEAIEGWQGTIESTEPTAQFDDAFVLAGDYPVQFGISSAIAANGLPVYAEELESLRDSGKLVEVWGEMACGVPDVNGCQIQAARLRTDGMEIDTYSGWELYENPIYGFRLRYTDIWNLVEVPSEDTSAQGGPVFGPAIQLTNGDVRLTIGYRGLGEDVILGGTGMPAGEQAMMGMVRILGQEVEKIALVYEGKVKAVSYSPIQDEGMEFVVRVDDGGGRDYISVELPMDVLDEIDQMLGTLEVVGGGG